MAKYIFTLIVFVFSFNLYAQECGIDYLKEKYLKAHPNAISEDSALISSTQIEHLLNRRSPLIIPVVVHVMHQNGSENISDEQILNAIELLNEDFSLTNADFAITRNTANAPFKDLAANMNIEFRLATIDPYGNCTNGINRIETIETHFADDYIKYYIKWPVDRYVNIWVVRNIYLNGESNIAGYANFPWMSLETDGIVIRSDLMGSIGTASGNSNSNSTLTHEMGHLLDIYHTFQGGCNQNGDMVDDTPPVSYGGVNRDCPVNGNSCPIQSPDLLDMWENFMDYSRGTCRVMFTHGQKLRAYACLESYQHRKNLYSNQNLIDAGVLRMNNVKPDVFFSSSKMIVCEGEPVQFFEQSCKGEIDSRKWHLEGTDSLIYFQKNPTVIYSLPGEYKVSLTVANAFGSDSATIDKFIKVKPRETNLSILIESFEKADWMETGWEQLKEFKITDKAAFYGAKSLLADCQNTLQGTSYSVLTPAINIQKTSALNPRLSFMVGYAIRFQNESDILRIHASKDCGNTFVQIHESKYLQLVATKNFSSLIPNFTPQSEDDWKRIQVILWDFLEESNVIFKIEVISAGANPMYIDAINVSQFYTGIDDVESFVDLSVTPNPSNDLFHISFNANSYGAGSQAYVTDISGRIVAELFPESNSNNVTQMVFNPNAHLLNSGIYFLMLKTEKGILSKKLIFLK